MFYLLDSGHYHSQDSTYLDCRILSVKTVTVCKHISKCCDVEMCSRLIFVHVAF